jgi:hypothetical protein
LHQKSISFSFVIPKLSRRYLKGPRRASCSRISSSNHAELVSHLDMWKGHHPCRLLLPPYPTTFPFRGNPKVR